MISKRPSIDFPAISSAALANARRLLTEWLPGGSWSGAEYQPRNPTRDDKHAGSFVINSRTGKWIENATGDRGGDMISLYAYLNSMGQSMAARAVASQVGIDVVDDGSFAPPSRSNVVPLSSTEPGRRSPWRPIMPVPDDAGEPPVAHPVRGRSDASWTYFDADGRINGFVHRFKTSDGGKETLPVCFAEHTRTGERGWRWLGFPEPRPLYGLYELAQHPVRPVLLVEGEKCADAGHELLRDQFVVVSWPGGGKATHKADWSPLYGRIVFAWADCDAKREKVPKGSGVDPASMPILPEEEQPGIVAMAKIREIVLVAAPETEFYLVDIPKPGDKPDGWDIADAVMDGFGRDELQVFIRNVRADDAKDAPDSNVVELARPDSPNKKTKKPDKPTDWGRYNRLIEQFVLIYGTDTCFDTGQRMVIKVNHLRLAYGNDYVKMWLSSDKRRMILPDQLVFDPSCKCKPPNINLFDGLPMKPKEGDYSPIMALIYHLCADSADDKAGVDDIVLWALKWIALPLQKPGTKMRSALVFHGPQGAGKNLFFEIIAKIYGRYAVVVGQEQIEDKFNDWASQKLFVIGDEVVARQELYHQKNKLKAFITGETIQINTKMMPLRTEANHVNVVFLSNEHQPLALEEGDRRYFIVYTPPARDDGLYARVADCLNNGGAEAFYYFLTRLDLNGFSPFDHPPMSAAKRDLIDLGLRPAERFLYEWLRGQLPLPLHACSAGQLFRVFKSWATLNSERFTPNQEQFTKTIRKSVMMISRALKKPDLLVYKVVKIPYSNSSQKTERVWIPDGHAPEEGQTEGQWMVSQIERFKGKINDFLDSNDGKSS